MKKKEEGHTNNIEELVKESKFKIAHIVESLKGFGIGESTFYKFRKNRQQPTLREAVDMEMFFGSPIIVNKPEENV